MVDALTVTPVTDPARRRLLSLLPAALFATVQPGRTHAIGVPEPPLTTAQATPSGGERSGSAARLAGFVPLRGLPPLPEPVTLRFQVYYGDASRDLAVAEIDYQLTHGDGRYRLATEGRAIGMLALVYSGTLTQTSTGLVGDGGLAPEQYTEQRGRRPERSVRFDPKRRVLIGRGDPPEVSAPAGTQDRLSVFYQIGLIARARGAAFVPGYRFRVPLATMRDVDVPDFEVVARESLKTGRGAVSALRVHVRNAADASDPEFDVWLAPELAMLPARIRMRESDGKVVDQVLQSPR